MPTPGIIISKLGVHASTLPESESIRGLICLKITLPRESEGRQAARLALFNSAPPRLLSIPALYPLPAPLSLLASKPSASGSDPFHNLSTAITLLSLPSPSTYPPNPQPGPSTRPYIDVSKSTGQVYVVVDPVTAGRRLSGRVEAKSEWLAVIEFETDLVKDGNELFKATIPLPRSLDNVVRFRIIPSAASDSSEVNIRTEPKVLALPPSTFQRQKPLNLQQVLDGRLSIGEDGWEDGEVAGAAESEREEEEDQWEDESQDDDGNWLEGKFQSTDVIRLEWSFNTPQPRPPPQLRVTPVWDKRHPTISVSYEAHVPSSSGSAVLETILPPGWGWSELFIHADDMTSWQSTDCDGLDWTQPASAVDQSADDSFSTVVGGLPRTPSGFSRHSSASILNQTLPDSPLDMPMDEFSFEVHGLETGPAPPSRPGTPSARRFLGSSDRSIAADSSIRLTRSIPASTFDLVFAEPDNAERKVTIQGVLSPLSLTLVCADHPVAIPTVKLDEAGQACIVYTPAREPCTFNTTDESAGEVAWVEAGGRDTPRRAEVVSGAIRVRSQRNVWGIQTVAVSFPWPRRARDIGFSLPPGSTARITRATLGGTSLARCVRSTEDGTEVRVGKREGVITGGKAEVVVEVEVDGVVALPVFLGAEGVYAVDLGEGWQEHLPHIKTSLTRDSPSTFTTTLPSSTPTIHLSSKSTPTRHFPKLRALMSWSTLFNLFLLWLVVSMAQQMQRMRNELAFVADDTQDLRLYALERAAWEKEKARYGDAGGISGMDGVDHGWMGSGSQLWAGKGDEGRTEGGRDVAIGDTPHGLSRVVFKPQWDAWARHPTVRTITDTVAWFWSTVRWLIAH